MVLQEQRSARLDPCRPLGQCGGLFCRVHHAEAVDNQVGRLVASDRFEPSGGEQVEPGSPMWAAILGDSAAFRKKPGRAHPAHRLGCLRNQGGRLGAPGLFRHRRVLGKLGQAATRAKPHLQRITGRLPAQVEYQVAGAAPARPAGMLAHAYPPISNAYASQIGQIGLQPVVPRHNGRPISGFSVSRLFGAGG